MKAYDEIPKECPICGDADEAWSITAEDFTRYDDEAVESRAEDFDEDGNPEDQPVRVFCRECSGYMRLSVTLVERIAS